MKIGGWVGKTWDRNKKAIKSLAPLAGAFIPGMPALVAGGLIGAGLKAGEKGANFGSILGAGATGALLGGVGRGIKAAAGTAGGLGARAAAGKAALAKSFGMGPAATATGPVALTATPATGATAANLTPATVSLGGAGPVGAAPGKSLLAATLGFVKDNPLVAGSAIQGYTGMQQANLENDIQNRALDFQERRLQMEEDDFAIQKKRRQNLERILASLLGSEAFRPGAGIAANPYMGGEN